MNGYDLAAVGLSVTALLALGVGICFRRQLGRIGEAYVTGLVQRLDSARRRRLLKIEEKEGTAKARIAAANAAFDHNSALHLAMAEAVQGAVDELRAILVAEQAKIAEARGDALAQAAAAKARPRRRFLRRCLGAVLGPLRNLWGSALDFLRYWDLELIMGGAVILVIWGCIALNIAHTSPHSVTGAVVCKSYIDKNDQPYTGKIETSKGNFTLDPVRVGRTVLTSSAAAGLYHKGDILKLLWHGGFAEPAYLIRATIVGHGGSCPGKAAAGLH
jgi:hypothetical protein